MRITQNQFFQMAMGATQKHAQQIIRAQERIGSGRQILRPSDDPNGARRSLFLESNIEKIGEYSSNLDDARRFLDTAAEALTGVSNLVSEVRAAALAGANGTLSQADRDTFALQIDALREQLVGLANSEFQGQFLFAGTENTRSPFQIASGSVGYRGNTEGIRSAVSPGLQVVMNVTGPEVFQSRTPLIPAFLGDTGVAAGSTPSSFRGETTLLLEHVASTLGDGALGAGGDTASGIVPGASSAASDTILGTHSLGVTVAADGLSGTVTLDGGRPVDFTPGDTDLRVTADDGSEIYLDMSGVVAGYQGSVAVDASGTYSLDGGTTTTPINFADGDQTLTEPDTGKALQIDSTGVSATGSAQVLFQGGLDLFETLAVLRDDLFNEDGLGSAAIGDRVAAHVDELDRHLNTVLTKLSDLGSRSASLENVGTFLDQQDLNLRDTLSSIRDTDISETIIDLVRSQTLMDAASAVSNRVLQNSLANFLG